MLNFHIRDLLILLSCVAVWMFGCQQTGFQSQEFWITTTLSFVAAIACFFSSYSTRGSRSGLIAWLGVTSLTVLVAMVFQSLHLVLFAIFTIIAGYLFLLMVKSHPRVIGTGLCFAWALSILIPTFLAVYERQQLRELRLAFPFEDLQHRLRYEVKFSATPVSVPSAAEFELRHVEYDATRRGVRQEHLRALHDENILLHRSSIGFGLSDQMLPSLQILSETVPRIPLGKIWSRSDLTEQHYGPSHAPRLVWNTYEVIQPSENMVPFHKAIQKDFFDCNGFGIRNAEGKVAGFLPHGFHFPPILDMDAHPPWKLLRIELLSNLRFEEPRVYVSENLPRISDFSNKEKVKTRNLDRFESTALRQLERGEVTVMDESESPKIRMLGALRAANQCCQCHAMPRGAILGAFSYTFERTE